MQPHPESFALLNRLIRRSDSREDIEGKLRVLGTYLEAGDLPTDVEVRRVWNRQKVLLEAQEAASE